MTPQNSDWLKTSELESRYRVPESTWRYWRHRGYGPPSVKVGRHVLYRKEDVESWLDELQASQRSATDRAHS